MRKQVIQMIVGTLLLLNAPFASASDHVISVCKVQITVSGLAYLQPCGGWTSVAGNSGSWITWNANSVGGQLMYKSAVAARLAGSEVTIRVYDNNSNYQYDLASMIRFN